jgi:hypothetical protein
MQYCIRKIIQDLNMHYEDNCICLLRSPEKSTFMLFMCLVSWRRISRDDGSSETLKYTRLCTINFISSLLNSTRKACTAWWLGDVHVSVGVEKRCMQNFGRETLLKGTFGRLKRRIWWNRLWGGGGGGTYSGWCPGVDFGTSSSECLCSTTWCSVSWIGSSAY